MSSKLVEFRKSILEAPSNKCFCKKLQYGRLGGTIAWDEANKMLEVVNLSVDDGVGQLCFVLQQVQEIFETEEGSCGIPI